jgi:hypothetical protein
MPISCISSGFNTEKGEEEEKEEEGEELFVGNHVSFSMYSSS